MMEKGAAQGRKKGVEQRMLGGFPRVLKLSCVIDTQHYVFVKNRVTS